MSPGVGQNEWYDRALMAQPPPPYGGDPNNPFGQQPQYQPPADPYAQPGYQQPPAYTPPAYGQPQPYMSGPVQYGAQGVTPGNNVLALISMILGIAGLVLMCAYGIGFLPGAAGLVLGFVGRSQINRSGGLQGGSGMAMAGIIMGAIAVGLSVIVLVAILVFGAIGAFSGN